MKYAKTEPVTIQSNAQLIYGRDRDKLEVGSGREEIESFFCYCININELNTSPVTVLHYNYTLASSHCYRATVVVKSTPYRSHIPHTLTHLVVKMKTRKKTPYSRSSV